MFLLMVYVDDALDISSDNWNIQKLETEIDVIIRDTGPGTSEKNSCVCSSSTRSTDFLLLKSDLSKVFSNDLGWRKVDQH